MPDDTPTALAGPPRDAPPPCASPPPAGPAPVYFVAGRIVSWTPSGTGAPQPPAARR